MVGPIHHGNFKDLSHHIKTRGLTILRPGPTTASEVAQIWKIIRVALKIQLSLKLIVHVKQWDMKHLKALKKGGQV